MHYALLYNPIAGRGRATAVAGAVTRRLEGLGHEVRECRSERAGHIREMSRERSGEVDRILVLGGDGSVREAAMGILDRPPAERSELGVLPFGSGNVIARELGLPLEPLHALDTIDASASYAWDVGWARADEGEREAFLGMVGVGYDAAIAERVGRSRSAPMGRRWYRVHAESLYVWTGVTQLFQWRQPRFSIEVDGEDVEPSAVAAVASNTHTYAKGMTLTPDARPDDGQLHLHVRRNASFLVGGLALVVAQLGWRSPKWIAGEHSGTRVRFEAADPDAPVPWQVDGDWIGRARRIDVELEEEAIRLVGPIGALLEELAAR